MDDHKVQDPKSVREPANINLTPAPSAKDVVESNLSAKDLANLPLEDINLSAHEVRTVLTVMRNYLWVSTYQQDEPLGPKVKRNLSIVSYALDYLVMLVENNLTVKKIERNEVKVTITEKDLAEIVSEIIDEYKDKAARAGVSLIYETSIPKAITKIDVQKTKDAIGRIIENAIKFTPNQGKVSFKIMDSDNEDFFEIRISDTGPGIAKHEHQALFKKYGKIDASYVNVREQDGAGLGLYIAAKYIDMQNGKIAVQSDAGAGATFVVSLPKIAVSQQLSDVSEGNKV